MLSSFNLKQQDKKVENKIVVALERISEAFRVLLWKEGKENSLSPIQIQILIFLLFHSQEKCKVTYLADEFNMTKATISDSVKVLLQKDLIKKTEDASDTRSYTITLTPEGKEVAEKASSFANAIAKPLDKLTAEQKTIMLNGLLHLIHDLNKAGIITVQRMCLTCTRYSFKNGIHYCSLLQSELSNEELKVDCPEHELKN